jgi:hypothetical protein
MLYVGFNEEDVAEEEKLREEEREEESFLAYADVHNIPLDAQEQVIMNLVKVKIKVLLIENTRYIDIFIY